MKARFEFCANGFFISIFYYSYCLRRSYFHASDYLLLFRIAETSLHLGFSISAALKFISPTLLFRRSVREVQRIHEKKIKLNHKILSKPFLGPVPPRANNIQHLIQIILLYPLFSCKFLSNQTNSQGELLRRFWSQDSQQTVATCRNECDNN